MRSRTERRRKERARKKAVKHVNKYNEAFITFTPALLSPARIQALVDSGLATTEGDGQHGTLTSNDPEAAWAMDPWLWASGSSAGLIKQKQILGDQAPDAIYICKDYQASVFGVGDPGGGWPKMWHLSIKRRDRGPIDENRWRILQQIKNTLVGEENEAVEMYPAESRLVDTANQWHLYCFADPKERWPFGFTERHVTSDPGGKAVQRPFDDGIGSPSPEDEATFKKAAAKELAKIGSL